MLLVVKVNVNRITDIGILEYYQVKEFIDELEMLQLSQLEDLSPVSSQLVMLMLWFSFSSLLFALPYFLK